jgi:hypothetical protein
MERDSDPARGNQPIVIFKLPAAISTVGGIRGRVFREKPLDIRTRPSWPFLNAHLISVPAGSPLEFFRLRTSQSLQTGGQVFES